MFKIAGGANAGLNKEDPEQLQKYDEIRDLLLAGGYFRARISTLDQFDKVVGGMVWCIMSSQVRVDFQLLFQEHARIGEKVQLSENIEQALIQMKCPFPIQSQQILYLDCIKLFPIVQWLVKKVIETRTETGDQIRAFSEFEFGKEYELPSETSYMQTKKIGLDYLKSTFSRYNASRQYRVSSKRQSKVRKDRSEEEERVMRTLLEYGHGHLYTMALLSKREKEENPIGASLPTANEPSQEQEKAAQAKRQQDTMMKGMAAIKGEAARVEGSVVSEYVGLASAEIIKQGEEYTKAKEEVSQITSETEKKVYGEQQHQKFLAKISAQIEQQTTVLAESKAKHDQLLKQVEVYQKQYEQCTTESTSLQQKIADLLKQETPENASILAELRALVALRESLKSQLNEFKGNCKDQKAFWDSEVAKLAEL
eukprot:TRINITY_DN2886_c0_g1_i2.p1 TRINITY_DN2886_c0_g1~~TRINITY_DN2886_c0_g1_i2.p1  ORF type:complete len:435 (-),score=91.03 TRINITY_DN2886_c0_g1_i2:112-1386(-)